jgi:pSer/pThr/pTyr-binding forkhead associated (FHA) protein
MDNRSRLQAPGLPEKAYLVVNARLFHLDKEIITIGRNIENDLVLNDLAVSRHHAEIRYEDSQFLLIDLGSMGGTYLNNHKVTKGVLFSGDIIVFSKIPVMFMNEGASIKDQSSRRTEHLDKISKYPTKPYQEGEGE